MKNKYVHGYSRAETKRLRDQAATLEPIIHPGTHYLCAEKVLEAGCGVGAQTVLLARRSPETRFTSVDISENSVAKASALIRQLRIKNVEFRIEDLNKLSFRDNTFHHIFVCFILEHLPNPQKALKELKRVLKKGGTITVIEGDHDSCFFTPSSREARHVWQCLVKSQELLGGDSLIGRRLYPVLRKAGFKDIKVKPCPVYADASLPQMVRGFTKETIIAMVKSAEKASFKFGLTDRKRWNAGIKALYKAAGKNGTLFYTFSKATGVK
jgi:SAM-dependent methyltransferase